MRCPSAELVQLDAALASLACDEAVLHLHLGQALEVIGRGAVFDLGFSSLAAYAIERCERSGRWAEGARCLARRVERLPGLRRALATGRVSWSMGELLARVAEPESEAGWLEAAEGRTVRQMRVVVAEAVSNAQRAGLAPAVASAPEEPAIEGGVHAAAAVAAPSTDEARWADGANDACTLVCTVNREEAWLFEATRSLLAHLGAHDADAQSEALLAEAQEALLRAVPKEALELGRWQSAAAAQQRWVGELRRWRDEAEQRCEGNVLRAVPAGRASGEASAATPSVWVSAATRGMASIEHASRNELDRLVREIHAALARHELDLSVRVLQFHQADGWRQLGYATETQYARERLGMSRSSFMARRSLALRLDALPAVSAALGAGQIGVEAALQLVRVATPDTQVAWVERARKRTIKHLREEVAAALTAIRWSNERDCPPPDDGEMAAFQRLERAVLSGLSQNVAEAGEHAAPAPERRRAWRVMLSSLASWLAGEARSLLWGSPEVEQAPNATKPAQPETGTKFENHVLAAAGIQTSAAGTTPSPRPSSRSGAGRVTLRLQMSRDTRAWWRDLEALARRWLPPTMSWLRFLCSSLWRAWRHELDSKVAYAHIYARDRYRCMSPVCDRRDVTPHHLKFRSAGGGDEDENVASLCTWCHLHGVHGGRIRATGTAALIHWEFGATPPPCLIVHGRERS